MLAAAALAQNITPDRMTGFCLAYLFKNETPTSCMAAVIDRNAAFMAANCIDLTGNNVVDTSVNYKLHCTKPSSVTDPEYSNSTNRITIHPSYNPDTLDNNIAIIQTTFNEFDGFVGYIGTENFAVQNDSYVRRDYDTSKSSWGGPVVFNQESDDSDCADGFPLYAASRNWMTCTSSYSNSSMSDDCYIPYGIMYEENTPDIIAMDSIYSHSVICGSDMCTKSVKVLSYYTELWPYVGFGVSTISRGINVYEQSETMVGIDTTISLMNSTANTSVPETTIKGGDLYPKQREFEASMYAASALATDLNHDNNQGSSPSTTPPDHCSDGFSNAQKIAIGITVPLAVIIIIIGCVIMHHIWKVKRQDRAWDPDAESLNLHDVALEINANDPFIVPPPYNQANETPDTTIQQSVSAETKK
ncbi:hypothetical protein IW138_004268 [Coemansia sp. RSA 986]|nr:hypothetical protein LPJ74_004333 [Coemansia sp. RSA 1843]KAJ2088392.1 hypothetical protein IW138_004268 [Coemansia sp. RSA 986]